MDILLNQVYKEIFMKLNTIFTLSALLIGASTTFAMEKKARIAPEQVVLQDYNAAQDEKQVLEIFEKDWANQYIGKPYSPELAKLLIENPYKEGVPSLAASYNKVFKHDGKVIGFITYYSHNERPSDNDEGVNNKKEGYIESFSIQPEYHDNGIEEHFLRNTVLPQLKKNGAEYMVAYLLKSDKKNIELFEKLGYAKRKEVYRGHGWQMFKTNFEDIK